MKKIILFIFFTCYINRYANAAGDRTIQEIFSNPNTILAINNIGINAINTYQLLQNIKTGKAIPITGIATGALQTYYGIADLVNGNPNKTGEASTALGAATMLLSGLNLFNMTGKKGKGKTSMNMRNINMGNDKIAFALSVSHRF